MKLLALSLFFVSTLSFATANAIIASDPKLGFKLSDAAKRRIGYSTISASELLKNSGATEIELSEASTVEYGTKTGLYRVRDSWIQRVPVTALYKDGRVRIKLRPGDLEPRDEIVKDGVAILRVTELFLQGD